MQYIEFRLKFAFQLGPARPQTLVGAAALALALSASEPERRTTSLLEASFLAAVEGEGPVSSLLA